MDSITLTLTGNSSQLQADYFPSIDLSGGDYVCGLIDFQTFNSIPNVDETNNAFHFGYVHIEDKRNENDILPLNSTENSVEAQLSDKDETFYSVELITNNETNRRKKRAVGTSKNVLPISCIHIPIGSYEVENISKYLKKALSPKGVFLELEPNKNTLKCEIL